MCTHTHTHTNRPHCKVLRENVSLSILRRLVFSLFSGIPHQMSLRSHFRWGFQKRWLQRGPQQGFGGTAVKGGTLEVFHTWWSHKHFLTISSWVYEVWFGGVPHGLTTNGHFAVSVLPFGGCYGGISMVWLFFLVSFEHNLKPKQIWSPSSTFRVTSGLPVVADSITAKPTGFYSISKLDKRNTKTAALFASTTYIVERWRMDSVYQV